MSLDSIPSLLIEQLQDLLNAERQLTKALPKMAKASSDEDLRAAFEDHLDETEEHVSRVERALDVLGASGKGKTCKAMEGLIEEGSETIKKDGEPGVKDAALIAAAQRIEHYEIAAYGTVRALAELLDQAEIAELAESTLEEEKATDEKLTSLAASINEMALDAADVTEEE